MSSLTPYCIGFDPMAGPHRSGRRMACSAPWRTHERNIAALSVLLAACIGTTREAGAQSSPEIVRGRVTDDSARAVHASIRVTRGPDRLTLGAETDSAGRYGVRFEQGTGDYLVYVTAPGFRTARRRVQRQASEHELVADFVLARDLTQLDTVKVTAAKPERASNSVDPSWSEPGTSENWTGGVNGQLPPSVAGNLVPIASTMSNVVVGPSGPTILGAAAASNLTTLNGMAMAAGAIPRAAKTETRVTGATFDATRGGFSGANIDVRLSQGSREYQERRAFLAFDPPALQFADPTSRKLGARNAGIRGSAGADGEIIRDVMTYNVALDVAHSASSPVSLLTADADVLQRAGLSTDSVAKLKSVAGPLGLTLDGGGAPADRGHDAITWLGRLDDSRDSLSIRALTTYVDLARDGAVGVSALSTPSTTTERRHRSYGAQFLQDLYVGAGRLVINTTRLAASATRDETAPYVLRPAASVLLRSASTDPTADVTGVSIGGAGTLGSRESRWTAEAGSETDWNVGGRRHRLKAFLWGRADGSSQSGIGNGLGVFSYHSLDDLAVNTPSSFTRILAQPARTGSVWNAAAAFSDYFSPTRYLSVQYGARLEADGFFQSPPVNPALDAALGVRSGVAPTRLHVSPRLGFSYMYNRSRNNGSSGMFNNVGVFRAGPSGIISGGIGEFRDLLQPGLLADASAASGVVGATTVLSCIGSAVPVPDWAAFGDPSAIPGTCANGGGLRSELAPPVTLISPGYDVPRSWRVALNWNSNVGPLLFRINALGTYDLSQPGTVDANFGGRQQFTLTAEDNRPVFVPAAAVDPTSGALSAAASRRSDAFGPVAMRVSDLRGYGGQLTFVLEPNVFRLRNRFSLYGSLSYTLQGMRRQYRGFDGAAFGDPRTVEWTANANDARHILVLSGGFGTNRIGVVTMFARFQSGLPFTPVVAGDVNGDGQGGDRAFIPDPTVATDPTLAAGISSLLANGSSTARRCLQGTLGRVPELNGCRGPWTQAVNMQWSIPTPARWGNRVTPTLYLQNLSAGLDQVLHGSDDLRGWGSPTAQDPVLLQVRGFDASSKTFRYDVNPRFADTRLAHTLALNPFRIAIDVSFQLSTNYDLQRLRRAVEPVRAPEGYRRRSADSLTAFYLQRTSNIHRWLVEQSDSLLMSRDQISALQHADSIFSARVRAVYRPLGAFLASANGTAGPAQLDSVRATEKSYWKIFWEQPEIADSIITPVQRELVPFLKQMLSLTAKQRETNRYFVGYPVAMEERRVAPR